MIPNNNLPPESQPWGRSIEAQLRELQTAQTTHETRTGNTAAGLQGTLRKISEQIHALEEVTQGLVEVTNTLTEQQATLAAQQVRILELIDTQIELVDAARNDPGVGYTTTWADRALWSGPIPAGGYTKVTFSGASVASCYNTTGNDVYIIARTFSRVSGGTEYRGATTQTTVPPGYEGTTTAPHSATHNIPPGATTFELWASVCTWNTAVPADPANFVGLEGVVLFSK